MMSHSITAEEYFSSVPLYRRIPISANDLQLKIEYFSGALDIYCIECKQVSVFRSSPIAAMRNSPVAALVAAMQGDKASDTSGDVLKPRVFVNVCKCSRDSEHTIIVISQATENALTKIGQFPSLADLKSRDLSHYRPVIGENEVRELSRAVGLSAHGIGIGSFVYLRRVFEQLIQKARNVAAAEKGWDDDAFQRARMDERIQLLSTHLPSVLVENRKLYGILSKGIHELSEEECLGAFDIVYGGIEMILDEILAERRRAEQAAKLRNAISSFGAKRQ